MDAFDIVGGAPLEGEVELSASKNSSLPILAASLLFKGEVRLTKLPELNDIATMIALLEEMGVSVKREGDHHVLNADTLSDTVAPYERVRKMRASILVLGPLLGRFGKAKVSLPGGCAIGARPIDIHLEGLKKMGASLEIDEGYVVATAKKLRGARITLPFPSVGATENLMMAACFAQGETIISNAAREPEIQDLAAFLGQAGVSISGIGTSDLVICGVSDSCKGLEFSGKAYRPIADRIEAATFLVAGPLCKSQTIVKGARPEHLEAFLSSLESCGVQVTRETDRIVSQYRAPLKKVSVDTAVFPGFPTDAQAQMMVLLTQAQGTSVVTEHIFENRFMHVPELNRLGANIELKGKSAFISGVSALRGAPVMCTDLRASAALILASLIAEGKTRIRRVYHVDRGYEKIEQKFRALGANIERVRE